VSERFVSSEIALQSLIGDLRDAFKAHGFLLVMSRKAGSAR
jgi:hypothetical protein